MNQLTSQIQKKQLLPYGRELTPKLLTSKKTIVVFTGSEGWDEIKKQTSLTLGLKLLLPYGYDPNLYRYPNLIDHDCVVYAYGMPELRSRYFSLARCLLEHNATFVMLRINNLPLTQIKPKPDEGQQHD